MPNWCENKLILTGSNEERERFKEAVKGFPAVYPEEQGDNPQEEVEQFFTFNSMVPVPDYVLQAGYSEAGYEWQSSHWGTKWDVGKDEVVIVEEDDTHITYHFSTAWSPPLPWVEKVSLFFPSLTFELQYLEEGMFFAGYHIFEQGSLREEEVIQEDHARFRWFLGEKFEYDDDYIDEFMENYTEY